MRLYDALLFIVFEGVEAVNEIGEWLEVVVENEVYGIPGGELLHLWYAMAKQRDVPPKAVLRKADAVVLLEDGDYLAAFGALVWGLVIGYWCTG